ncbi:MAG TPA: NUDIX domain-containing protein [Candidatus Sulfomarinibacteraceae bacterium]|nr:NUDIX domain-containing protein [Candidatus Sulfomarinibacteraceae bacterium]
MSRPVSAGILLYRYRDGEIEVLLAHPGGPFFDGRDHGHWTIPKGEPAAGDDLLETAGREFEEETGHALATVAGDPAALPLDLGSVVQASGKRVYCWAVEGDLDPTSASSNTFEMAWPPGSGRMQRFLEIDAVAWYAIPEALRRANPSQTAFVHRLVAAVGSGAAPR